MLNLISFLKMVVNILDKKTKGEWELEIHNGGMLSGYHTRSGLELVAGFKAVPKAMGMSVQVDLDIESEDEKMVESREAFLIQEPKDSTVVVEWFLDQIEIAENELFAQGKKFASRKVSFDLNTKSILKMLVKSLNMSTSQSNLQGDWHFENVNGVLTGEQSNANLELVAGFKAVPKAMGVSVQVDLDIESKEGEKMVESREAFLIQDGMDIEDMANWFLDQLGFAEEAHLDAPQHFASRKARRASIIRGRYGR